MIDKTGPKYISQIYGDAILNVVGIGFSFISNYVTRLICIKYLFHLRSTNRP